MMSEETPRVETFSEQMARLQEKADDISGALTTLLTCKREGNSKQVAYWVGKVSHDASDLCKECLGEELLKKMATKKQEKIITP
jgi:hypothetical protein